MESRSTVVGASPCVALPLLLALASACGPVADGTAVAGLEGEPCLQGQCFEGLQCLSDLCVGASGGATTGRPGDDGPQTSANSGPSSATTGPGESNGDGLDGVDGLDGMPEADSSPDASADGGTNTTRGTSSGRDESSTSAGSDETSATESTGTAWTCGNGAIDENEQCDGADLQGYSCATFGLGRGELTCDPIVCTFDTSLCEPNQGPTSG